MKLTLLLCLTLALVNVHNTLAKKKGGLFDKIFNKNKIPKPKDDFKSKPNQFNPGGTVNKQDIPGSSYNQRPQQPAPGSPYAGGGQGGTGGHGGYLGHGGYPGQGGYPGRGYGAYGGYGGQGGYGGYPGGYINQNPNNHILSPHYGGSFGYGGYGVGEGSPFSRSVQVMGYVPSDKSKGFGRSAVVAAAGGAMAGMALGYGLGRFPRPHFHFHSPEEQYYYNYYMYRRYGLKSTDANDYSRDYSYRAPPNLYENFMNTCMKRKDLLPAQKKSSPSATKISTTTTTTTSTTTTTTTVPSSNPTSNIAQTRNATANNSTSSTSATSGPPKQPEASPGAPAAMAIHNEAADEDDDTVSVVEIGYPALIEQLKVRRCLELYMIHSEKYLRKNTPPNGGGQQLEMGSHWLLIALTSAIVIKINSDVVLLLH